MSGCFKTDGTCKCHQCISKFRKSIINVLQIEDHKPIKKMSDSEIIRELQAEVSVLSNRINKLKYLYRELNANFQTLSHKVEKN